MTPVVSVVIVNYNSGAFLSRCLSILKDSTAADTEIIIVDNASHDGSLERALSAHTVDRVVRNVSNRGPGPARNQGAAAASADVILFLDPDIALPPAGLDAMIATLSENPGVVAPALYSRAHDRLEYGGVIDLVGHPLPLRAAGRALYASASAFVTHRTLFESMHGFDDRFTWGEELDYCWRVLLAGGEVTILGNVVADHECGISAAGGYHRAGRLETTAFRLVNRERATLAAILKCAPASRLWWTVPAFAVYTAAMAAGAVSIGRADIALGLLTGLIWNGRQFRRTLGERQRIRASPQRRRQAATRIRNRIFAVSLLVHHGLPRFVDRTLTRQPDGNAWPS